MEHNRQPVDLGFDGKLGFGDTLVQFADAVEPGACIVGAEGVCQRQDRRGVAHFLEFIGRRRARALGRGVGRDPVGVLGFDGFQFIEQTIVFPVADDRRIEDVVAVIVLANFFAEGF